MGDRLGIPGAVGFCLLPLLPPPPPTPLTAGGAPFPTPPAACPSAADHPAAGSTGHRRVRCPALQPRSPGHRPRPAGQRSLRPCPLPVHKAAAAALQAQARAGRRLRFTGRGGLGGGFLQPGACTSLAPRARAQGTTVCLPAPGPRDTHLARSQIPGERTAHTPHPTGGPQSPLAAGPKTEPHTITPARSAHFAEQTTTRGKARRHTHPRNESARRFRLAHTHPAAPPLSGRDPGPGSEHKGHS